MAIQGSGFSNVVTGSLNGLQISGFNNTVTDTLDGVQASGFVNVSKEKLRGAQFAGFVNAAKKVEGYQLAGFVNAAKDVNGTQIGFINAARSYKSGAPIGFLNFVKDGYHKLEISGSETMLGNVTFKTGVERFYNILTVGFTPLNNRYAWSYGYGIGSMIRFNEKWGLNTDITGNHLSYNNKHLNELNLLMKWEVEANYFIGNHLSIFCGESLNGFFTSNYKLDGTDFDDAIIPFKTFEYDDAVVKQIYYPGVNIGIRF